MLQIVGMWQLCSLHGGSSASIILQRPNFAVKITRLSLMRGDKLHLNQQHLLPMEVV